MSQRVALPPPALHASQTVVGTVDKTLTGDVTFALSEAQDTPGPSKQNPKKKMKAKMTPREKKERGVRHLFPSFVLLAIEQVL